MSAGFDPYHEWLGIDPREQPVDHYRLLGLAKFETDARRIARAADERMALIRSYQSGKRRAFTQRLLNELSAARVTLLDPIAKPRYDAELAQYLANVESWRQASEAPTIDIPTPPQPAANEAAAVALAPAAPPDHSGERDIETHSAAGRRLAWAVLVVLVGAAGAMAGWYVSRVLRGGRQPAAVAPSTAERNPAPPAAAATPRPQRTITPNAAGELDFPLDAAALGGRLARSLTAGGEALTGWNSAGAQATWQFRLQKPGFFRAEVVYSTQADLEEAEIELRIDERVRRCTLRATGSFEKSLTDEYPVAVTTSGLHTLGVVPRVPIQGDALMLRSIRLLPMRAGNEP